MHTRTAKFSSMALLLVLATAANLPAQGRYSEFDMTVQYNVRIPMPDGVTLSADIYRPAGTGRHPAIMELTPYSNAGDNSMTNAKQSVDRGYAVVLVDVRGRYDSDGVFDAWRTDGDDGNAVLSWIARQPWSNGRIATRGGSYSGMNQWLMARHGNPAHRAILGYVAPSDGFLDMVRWNGVPKIDLAFTWMMGMDGRVNQPRAGWNWQEVMRQLPVITLDSLVGRRMSVWREWMRHDVMNDYWSAFNMIGTYERFDIPSFNVTGWYDGQLPGTLKHYTNSVRTGRVEDHRLVIGPWLHGVNRGTSIGDREYGPLAVIELDRVRDAWLDHIMLDRPRPAMPNVLYFLPVINEWRQADAWPVPGTQFTSFYLDSRGNAATANGDGVLRRDQPGSGRYDEFTFDPRDPVPTISSRTAGARGGFRQGSVDGRAVQNRQDVLIYTSAPLTEGVEITGPVRAVIHFSTDVPDTDISVKLLELEPDGRPLFLTEGIARARYRESYTNPKLLQPGEVYALEVELVPTANYFRPGHRIQIEVSSSDFPNYARNLNTGQHNETTTEMRVARTRIYHDQRRPSHIVLPIVRASKPIDMRIPISN